MLALGEAGNVKSTAPAAVSTFHEPAGIFAPSRLAVIALGGSPSLADAHVTRTFISLAGPPR